jgi:hypothetical protein
VVLGLSLPAFTALHVAISLVGLASGALVLKDMLRSRLAAGLTAVFLLTTAATSVSGFCFPSPSLGVGHLVGGLSLVVLAPTLMALYQHRLARYATGATVLLYLNVFIGVAQAFAKSATLQAIAPWYFVTQGAVLAIFGMMGVLAVRRFHPCKLVGGHLGGIVSNFGRAGSR